MIFHRALLREFAGLAGAVFMTLFAIAVTTQLIRLLGKAAGGSIPTDAVVAFLGFFALGALPVLLSLTMFISVLLTLTRSWRDSEMVIWFGSGLSLTAWLRPVMLFALPQIAVIAALSLFISPWAAQMSAQYAIRLEARDDVSRVSPGVFGETPNKERVYFVESISGDSSAVQNVFVSSIHQKKSGVSMSRTGRTETAPNGDRFIVLEQGRRYEGSPGDEQYRITEFDRYAARIETRENVLARLDARGIAVEFGDAVLLVAWRALVAPALLEHDEAIAVRRGLGAAGAAHADAALLLVDRAHEHILHRGGVARDRFHEIHALLVRRLAEHPGAHARDVVACLQANRVLRAHLRRPRRDEKRQRRDHRDLRQREQHHRPQPRGERKPGAEPDHHLRIAPAARQREQHRDEHGEREQHRQRAEGEEAEESDDRVGRNRTAGCLAEKSNQLRGDRDREQRHEHRAGETREFPEERPVEDHAILSAWNLA